MFLKCVMYVLRSLQHFWGNGEGISALTHHSEKSDNKGDTGMWKVTDGHVYSDPKSSNLHVWSPPNITQKYSKS